jgi:hypothetical protein
MAETITDLGEHAGVRCFWAGPSQSDEPGFYIESEGRRRRAWEPQFDIAGARVEAVKIIPWEPGMRGLAVELSNGISGAFRLPVGSSPGF